MFDRLLSIPLFLLVFFIWAAMVLTCGFSICAAMVINYERTKAFIIPRISEFYRISNSGMLESMRLLLSAEVDASNDVLNDMNDRLSDAGFGDGK